jgi:hypothetical protein
MAVAVLGIPAGRVLVVGALVEDVERCVGGASSSIPCQDEKASGSAHVGSFMNIAHSVSPAYFKKVSTVSQRRSAAVID